MLARLDRLTDRVVAVVRADWLTVLAGAGVTVLFLVSLGRYGLPLDDLHLFFWTTVGIVVAGVQRRGSRVKGLVRDWAPLLIVMFAYDYVRGYADQAGQPVHAGPQLTVDTWLGGGTTVVHRLQDWLWTGSPRLLDYVVLAVYLTHFFVPLVVGAVLWVRRRDVYRRYAVRLVGLWCAGLLTYFLYPASPPWLAANSGLTDAVTRTAKATFRSLAGVEEVSTTVTAHNSDLYNPVAALPSLHAAIPMLLLLFFWRSGRLRLRMVLSAYVVVMGFTLVYAGEHYVLDVAMGWAYAAAVIICFDVVSPRLRASQDRPTVTRSASRAGLAGG